MAVLGKYGGSLKYDFTEYGGTAGYVGEPSDESIEMYRKAIEALDEEVGMEDMPTEEEIRSDPSLARKAREMNRNFDAGAYHRRLVEIVSEHICVGKPSTEELMKLPPRIRRKFLRQVQQEMLNPEI